MKEIAALVISCLVLIGCAHAGKPTGAMAEDSAPTTVYTAMEVDTRPVPRVQPQPRYPMTLRQQRIQGQALVEFIVTPEGKVRDATAVKATHEEFGRAAVESVAKWQFVPGRLGGKPVAVRMQTPIVFSLR